MGKIEDSDAIRPELASFKYDGIPEEDAWWPSRLFFIWMKPLFQRAQYLGRHDTALQHEDLIPLPAIDHGEPILQAFERSWEAQEQEINMNIAKKDDDDTADKGDGDSNGDGDGDGGSNKTDRVRKATFAVIGRPFVVAGFLKFVNTSLQFSFPLLLQAILLFIEQSQAGEFQDSDSWGVRYRGYWLAGILFFVMASKAITENAYFHRVYRSGYQARIAVSVAVYNKALRLANSERQSTTLGELVNLMQVDAAKIEAFVPQMHVLWDGMLQIIGYMAILYSIIGWPCFAGLAVMMAAGPVQGVILQKLFKLNRQMVKYTDARVKTTNEALQGIQSVKMFAWEENFAKMVAANRNEELDLLKRVAYLRGFSRAYMSALPGLTAVVSFVVYALAKTGAEISASTLFSALVAFDQLRFPLLFYPMAFAQLAQASVSAARVQKFLTMKEVGRGEKIGNGTFIREEEAEKGEIDVKHATIYWSDPNIPIDETLSSRRVDEESEERTRSSDAEATDVRYPKPILDNVSMNVKPGELCAVVGRVGSGKSTLCSAILNETLLQSGEISLKGKVAYASQSPWILNASLRDNILFGLPMDQERYDQVLDVCQLSHDLAMLDYGDLTEIGERGINLSGGQKQRVSVARAAYADAATIILDDPLSALDPEVGKLLFDECINKFMEGKTRLLITNQLQFLKSCDTVVALRDGKVIEQGKFADLIADDKGEVSRLLNENSADVRESSGKGKKHQAEYEGKDTESGDKTNPGGPEKVAGALVTKEERVIGAVSISVYRKYLKAGGGYLTFAAVYCGFLLSAGNGLASSSWISYWTADAPDYERNPEAFYLGLFFILSVTLGLFTFIRSFLLVRFGVKASEALHRNLLDSILRAPQSFFDTTPIGRILSRFSKDLYSIDIELADTLDFFLFTSLQVVISLATILFVTPWFGVTIVPLAFLYFRVLNYFRAVSRETKRLESISRSPVFAQFSETLGGLSTIRAYGQPKRFIHAFEGKMNENTRANYNNKTADRWLSLRLELIGSVVAGLAAVFSANVAISGSVSGQESDSNFASLAGLSLLLSISLTGLLNWCVRSFAQLEAAMNACERVLHYTENIQQEAAWTSKELEELYEASKRSSLPPSDPSGVALAANSGDAATFTPEWPQKGEIVLKNLRMRYRSDTPLVLKGLNVTIAGGERIGVVGRTGSGKSSLLLTLLRLVEPSLMDNMEQYEAPIEIDGVDVLRIGLRELRSRLGIIPQNPVLFSGTIRGNIDIFDQFSDDQIWTALEKCGLKKAVEEMPGDLFAPVAEYGENLSAGMRQMLVLGRALLRQCRVLLLDEATSNVDFETDRAIQKTLRESFPGVTVLTIAHRVNTIMDSDKIMVMKDGLVDEFGPPQELLADESSAFSDIVRHAESGNE